MAVAAEVMRIGCNGGRPVTGDTITFSETLTGVSTCVSVFVHGCVGGIVADVDARPRTSDGFPSRFNVFGRCVCDGPHSSCSFVSLLLFTELTGCTVAVALGKRGARRNFDVCFLFVCCRNAAGYAFTEPGYSSECMRSPSIHAARL